MSSEHFTQITMIERDRLPAQPEFRSGTPQARHVHVLMQQGQRILDRLFPGLLQTLVDQGAVMTDVTNDMVWLNPAGWTPRHVSGLEMLCASRTLIEWGVRQRVLAIANVAVMAETAVKGLIADDDGTTITGVEILERNPESATEGVQRRMFADLVVDASGRNSKMPQWLAALGFVDTRGKCCQCSSRLCQPHLRTTDWFSRSVESILCPVSAANPSARGADLPDGRGQVVGQHHWQRCR